jgi:hypothetical protein
LRVVKSKSKFFAFLDELLFLEDFVRKHAEFKVEEIARVRVSELLRLVDFFPDSAYILINSCPNAFKVVSSIVKVAQNK